MQVWDDSNALAESYEYAASSWWGINHDVKVKAEVAPLPGLGVGSGLKQCR